MKGGTPFQDLSSLYSSSFVYIFQEKDIGNATRHYIPCASIVGSTLVVKTAPVPYLGTCEPFSLNFIPLCLYIIYMNFVQRAGPTVSQLLSICVWFSSVGVSV